MIKAFFLTASVAVSPVLAGFDTWSPPGPYDVRAPCPMLNTLANHGFLPHDGKDITREVTENALWDALNINKTLGSFLFDFALTTNPTANATTFSLNDLGNHNILEHDASLSRSDAYFGSTLAFNQSIFDQTKSYWTGKVITLKMAAKARLERIRTSQATNPTYSMSALAESFGLGESAAYVVVLGDKKTATVKRSWAQWFFEHEQLPQHLGWRRPAEVFQQEDLNHYIEVVQNLTKALGGRGLEEAAPPRSKRRNAHFGW